MTRIEIATRVLTAWLREWWSLSPVRDATVKASLHRLQHDAAVGAKIALVYADALLDAVHEQERDK